MGKKKQEMSQVYSNSNNEFIFGENGGKGKHLSSFLKNLIINRFLKMQPQIQVQKAMIIIMISIVTYTEVYHMALVRQMRKNVDNSGVY